MATEVIHRYTGSEAVHGFWSPTDTLTIQLRYFDHREDHKLLLIDGKPTERTFETLEGSFGYGEFGTTLSVVFDPASQTTFHWRSWKNVRKHRVAVFDYTNGPHSRYRLLTTVEGHTVEADVGYHGALEIDAETGEVLHLAYLASQIPRELHLRYAGNTVDYDLADVGDRRYLLPSRSEMEMQGQSQCARNVTEFREYRRFSADSTIDFSVGK